MRSPIATRGRNSFLENIFRWISGSWRTSGVNGSQRPVSRVYNRMDRRNYDLEVGEYPIRDYARARMLIEMHEWCPEISAGQRIWCCDILSSVDGDDRGFTISKWVDAERTIPVSEDVRKIALEVRDRLFTSNDLECYLSNLLIYGDTFCSVGIAREGISRNDYAISRLLKLPTWEMFRIETDNGALLGFEQRKHLSDNAPEYTFYPPQIIHWRLFRRTLYGRSLWDESKTDWADLKAATDDLAKAARSLGIIPNVHIMPEGADERYISRYREDYESQQADGVITDMYMLSGGDIKKLANVNPDLESLSEHVLQKRKRIIMASLIPIWRFAGFEERSNMDIMGQPAMAYARTVNSMRSSLSVGIRQAIDTELILRLGSDRFRNEGKYRIIWPQFAVNLHQTQAITMAEPSPSLAENPQEEFEVTE